MEEGLAEWKRASLEDEGEMALKSFRRPRNLLLCIVTCYFQQSVIRWRVLRRLLADSSSLRAPDTLDHKSHSVSRPHSNTVLDLFAAVWSSRQGWHIGIMLTNLRVLAVDSSNIRAINV